MEWFLKEICKFGCKNGECKEEKAQGIEYALILVLFVAAIAAVGFFLKKKRPLEKV